MITICCNVYRNISSSTFIVFYIGCGGYVNALNGDTQISNPHWYSVDLPRPVPGTDDETEYESKYPKQCFWFIEARHAGETISLRNEYRKNREGDLRPQLYHNPIVVSTVSLAIHFDE